MFDKYYTDRLYPLQDRVLKEIEKSNTFLYLTGGTVVSRFYLNHRYSDDLDLFANRHSDFEKEIDRVTNHLKRSFEIDLQVREESYGRAFVKEDDLLLKIDYVNDVGFHVDEVMASPLFYRTDNWRNILSNKITALSREEGKDAADIIFLCLNYPFNWQDIINDAKNKDSWIDEVNASKLLYDFQLEKLVKVKWIKRPDEQKIEGHLKIIAKDILMGKENTLVSLAR
ncbi:MAG: nucleotidyl transferase AbiEii/AbiGii toxin family protein [Cyclobacteriaceae bacterium]|nr:nucleotidyl transferase AbiEii/AbiGii toxin family protein [Cyclobacteriaceae bacterium]